MLSSARGGTKPDTLASFYEADAERARGLLDRLLEDEVRPVVRNVLRRKLAAPQPAPEHEVEDLCQDAVLRIAQQLLAGRHGEARIAALGAYAARAAEYAADEFFRRKFRRRYNAMKRVVVNLRENKAFYEWRFSAQEHHGALTAWTPPPPAAEAARAAALAAEPARAVGQIFEAYPDPAKKPVPGTARILYSTLRWAEGSLPVDDLVLAVQAARNDYDEPEMELKPELVAAAPAGLAGMERDFLMAIWAEVKRLRPLCSRALLLNLRMTGEFGIDAFTIFAGVRIEEMAGLLGFEPDRFERDVLPTLPWNDKAVASHLACTVEQVASLRSAARRAIAARIVAAGTFPEECFRFKI